LEGWRFEASLGKKLVRSHLNTEAWYGYLLAQGKKLKTLSGKITKAQKGWMEAWLKQ
jgi:hypothetical protein